MTKPIASTTPQRAAVLARQGAAIAVARRKANLTQDELATALGVSLAAVRAWEQGRRGCQPAMRRWIVKQWGGDPEILGPQADCCQACGRPWSW